MPNELATIPKAAVRYTGERIARTRPRIYRKIVRLLAAEVPAIEIANSCRVSEYSVRAIAAAKAVTITEMKSELAALSGRIAAGAGERIENDIASGRLPTQSLPVIFGIAVDKLMVLSDQPTARLAIDVSGQIDLVAQFRELTREIRQAVASEVIPIPDNPPTEADHTPPPA